MNKTLFALVIVSALALLSGCKYGLNPGEQMEVCDHCMSGGYQCQYISNTRGDITKINCVLPPSTP